jgi:polyphosphate kinase
VRLVSDELKARRFAGPVRLEVETAMPEPTVRWLASQLKVGPDDVNAVDHFLGIADLMRLDVADRDELRYPRHVPQTHPRLKALDPSDPGSIFDEIRRGDILLHHPYDSFDSSVLRFLESAAVDPHVLAIKLTIYRTSSDSPIVRALAEAARRGKQVAVLVEITARFDEAPNIAWGELLENEGVHVAYGVERLKTHVKLALVVREERGQLRRYAHVGTGNYHTGTARIYEDFGLLTAHPEICEDAASVFNELTGAIGAQRYRRLLVAPDFMRTRFVELIRREAEHARAGVPCGIYAKMNQLQDREVICELYGASRAGVPITLNVRGLCCLKPGLPGLSESIRVYSVVGRFLEHSRLYRFVNGGDTEYYTGSADWMKRNLENRVETIVPVIDREVRQELDRIIEVYENDNSSAWDAYPDGRYERRRPAEGEPRRAAQEEFIRLARERSGA